MQVFFLYYFRSILLFINTLIASAYIELTLHYIDFRLHNDLYASFSSLLSPISFPPQGLQE